MKTFAILALLVVLGLDLAMSIETCGSLIQRKLQPFFTDPLEDQDIEGISADVCRLGGRFLLVYYCPEGTTTLITNGTASEEITGPLKIIPKLELGNFILSCVSDESPEVPEVDPVIPVEELEVVPTEKPTEKPIEKPTINRCPRRYRIRGANVCEIDCFITTSVYGHVQRRPQKAKVCCDGRTPQPVGNRAYRRYTCE